jgi:hypothetical protein
MASFGFADHQEASIMRCARYVMYNLRIVKMYDETHLTVVSFVSSSISLLAEKNIKG